MQSVAKSKKGWKMYKDCEKKTLSEILGDKLITAPTVFECISARTVELCGYPAMILSGAGMSYCMNGLPDIGLINEEEVIYLTTRLTNYTPLPVIINAGAFYRDDPVRVYHICSRLVKAGADAIMIHSCSDTFDEIKEFLKEYNKFKNRKPLVVVPSSYPDIREEELIENGVNMVIYANHLLRSSYPAMVKTAESILKNKRAKEASDKYCMKIKDIINLIPGAK